MIKSTFDEEKKTVVGGSREKMYKFHVFPKREEVLPGQKALLHVDGRDLICPIYQHKEGYLWVFLPKIVQDPLFKGVIGRALQKPLEEPSTLLCFRRQYFFDVFFYCSYFKEQIKAPLLIELPERVSFGKIIPSTLLHPKYRWFSQYIASLLEIEELNIAHRLISPKQEFALNSFESIELQGQKKVFMSLTNPL